MSEVLILGFPDGEGPDGEGPDGEGEVVLVGPERQVPNGGRLY